ncbi:hypothetical protein FH972_005723 [Carpinus fangiana]|uniref:Uncharacterized protein n=1 Tax=Carpinus fangiana TaxID=176857 RepID=A0A5N6QR46_9ROSI|nr:hypothetical protein FH972_005723 [Carpinus fangiana]
MAGSGRWSVESKEFEMLVKGGAAGVRIFECSKGKQRSIFLQRDELAWLMGIVKEVVTGETSKVFWDQSRAGYPRVIAQKCSNRHGHFLTLEEFEGRRRCGTILVLEGRRGQGWVRVISELGLVNEAFYEAREEKGVKKGRAMRGRRSYVEAMGLSTHSEEECFNSFTEPIAKVPKWLKVASTEMNFEAQKVGSREKASEVSLASAKPFGEQGLASLRSLVRSLAQGMRVQHKMMELLASRDFPPMKLLEGTKSTTNTGHGLLQGQEGDVVHIEQSLNAQ